MAKRTKNKRSITINHNVAKAVEEVMIKSNRNFSETVELLLVRALNSRKPEEIL